MFGTDSGGIIATASPPRAENEQGG